MKSTWTPDGCMRCGEVTSSSKMLSSFSLRTLLMVLEVTTQGFRFDSLATSLRFLPVMLLISLPTRQARKETSGQGLLLRLWKNPTNLERISTLTEDNPQLRTCCARYVLVALGTFQESFMLVHQELYTCHAITPPRSQRLLP